MCHRLKREREREVSSVSSLAGGSDESRDRLSITAVESVCTAPPGGRDYHFGTAAVLYHWPGLGRQHSSHNHSQGQIVCQREDREEDDPDRARQDRHVPDYEQVGSLEKPFTSQ